jgi:hypothetical protein
MKWDRNGAQELQRGPGGLVNLGRNLRRIEEALDAASLDEFDVDPDAELFEISEDEFEDAAGGTGQHFAA